MTAILRVDQYESHFQITDLTIKKTFIVVEIQQKILNAVQRRT